MKIPGEPEAQCLKHVAGDELAQTAVGLALHWRVLTLQCTMESIMVMRVDGATEFEAATKKHTGRAKKDFLEVIALNNMQEPGTAAPRPPATSKGRAAFRRKGSMASAAGHRPGRLATSKCRLWQFNSAALPGAGHAGGFCRGGACKCI